MPRTARPAKAAQPNGPGIRDLLSYRLSRTANLMSRGAALRYRREFDVSLGEWRALALLADTGKQSLMQLSRAAGLDKAQMSRVVKSLTEHGLVVRDLSSQGGRAVELNLTRRGQQTYAGLIAAAAERDRALRAVLTDAEQTTLDAMLSKLAAAARGLIEAEAEKDV